MHADPETGEILQEEGEGRHRSTALVHGSTGGELERREAVAGVLRPVESPASLLEAQESTRNLIAEVLKEDRDFGVIPGTDRKTLLQPGAQRVASAFGCTPETELLEAEVDHDRVVQWEKKRKKWQNGRFAGWEREQGTSVGLYRFVARCRLRHRGTGVVVGEGLGICSSMEDRYVDRPRDLEHTIMRMATKRALVNAVLQTFALSEQFQDLEEAKQEREDLPVEEQVKIARGRYHSLLAELVPHPQIREFSRSAYQEAHPQFPNSSTEWELQHFQRAAGELEKFGTDTFTRAVAWKAEKDPARPVDKDFLDQLLIRGELSEEDEELVQWIRSAGVGSWTETVIARLGSTMGRTGGPEGESQPGGTGIRNAGDDPEELEAQAADLRDQERFEDDGLPF